MKKLILALSLMLPVVAQAQNDQVVQIRKQYAKAKADVALIDKGTSPMGFGHTVVTSNYTMPGSGPVKETIHYYYRGKTDDRTEEFYLFPFLVTRKYNIGAVDHYEEYLYNECGDGIAFFFRRMPMAKPVTTGTPVPTKTSSMRTSRGTWGLTKPLLPVRQLI